MPVDGLDPNLDAVTSPVNPLVLLASILTAISVYSILAILPTYLKEAHDRRK